MLGRVTAGLFFLLLIWGNLVAGMQAGEACPDWPLCHGQFLPPIRLDIWMEFMHRVIAALATIFLVLLARKRLASYRGFEKAIPFTALGLIALEIVLGGVVVLLGLPVQITTVHFMIGLAVFLLVLYMAICDEKTRPASLSVSGHAGLILSVMVIIFCQASLGAYLRHSSGGLACPDFPTCQGQWIPSFWDGPVVTHFSHRLLAVGTFLTTLALYVTSLLDQRMKRSHTDLLILMSLVAVQIGVGAAVVLTGLSFAVTSLHLGITLAIVAMGLRIWLRETREPAELAE